MQTGVVKNPTPLINVSLFLSIAVCVDNYYALSFIQIFLVFYHTALHVPSEMKKYI